MWYTGGMSADQLNTFGDDGYFDGGSYFVGVIKAPCKVKFWWASRNTTKGQVVWCLDQGGPEFDVQLISIPHQKLDCVVHVDMFVAKSSGFGTYLRRLGQDRNDTMVGDAVVSRQVLISPDSSLV